LIWNDAGILLSVFTLDEETFYNIEALYFFDMATGTITNEVIFYNGGETDDFIVERLFVQYANQTTLALRYFNSAWVLVDIATGEQQSIDSLPALYNPMFPDNVSLLMDVDTNYNYQWEMANDINANAVAFTLFAYPSERVALAPDGRGFAYADSVLHIWRDGQVIDIANSDGFADDARASILWFPKNWRVGDIGIPQIVAEPISCEGAPESQLSLGGNAITMINLNVRDNPSTTAEKIGEFLPEQEVSVVNGPECVDGYAWYFVQADSLMGWVAEGSGENYFVVPSP
jgi:Bacterial SH3 domain